MQQADDRVDSLSFLVSSAAGGDERAWQAIVARFESLLWSVARAHRLDTVDAADVVQTTWLRLLENLARISEPERLAGWLVTTSRRECLRLLRRSGREVVDDFEIDLVDQRSEPLDAALLARERDAALWSCFSQLPERCQRLLRVLMVAEPPAYAEISQSLGLPVGAIGPTRMRCLTKLRTLTAGAGDILERRS